MMRNLRVLPLMFAVASLVLLGAVAWAQQQPAAPPAANDDKEPAAEAGRNQEKADNSRKEDSVAERKTKLDEISRRTLDRLFLESPDAKALYNRAYGWAVFDTSKLSLGLSGAGGAGVASPKNGTQKTYMKMGSGGIGLGAGYQEYQIVFLFEDEKRFNNFVNEGWTADASATAVAGKAGAGAAGDFTNGIALFKLNEKGLAAVADITGTRYWKDKKLNT